MTGKPYPLFSELIQEQTGTVLYTFLSHGDEVILKAVVYSPIERDGQQYYNWGFGDIITNPNTGEFYIDDKVESNNGDIKSIFYTVISTLALFFEKFPNAILYVEGSNKQRMEVYVKLIARSWTEIEPLYRISGLVDGQIIAFQKDTTYQFLLITRKTIVT